jgi:hypothetical protein
MSPTRLAKMYKMHAKIELSRVRLGSSSQLADISFDAAEGEEIARGTFTACCSVSTWKESKDTDSPPSYEVFFPSVHSMFHQPLDKYMATGTTRSLHLN